MLKRIANHESVQGLLTLFAETASLKGYPTIQRKMNGGVIKTLLGTYSTKELIEIMLFAFEHIATAFEQRGQIDVSLPVLYLNHQRIYRHLQGKKEAERRQVKVKEMEETSPIEVPKAFLNRLPPRFRELTEKFMTEAHSSGASTPGDETEGI